MAKVVAVHVEETATISSRTLTLTGASSSVNRRFSAACSVNDTFDYSAKDTSGNWENGVGTYSASNAITLPAAVEAGSNSTSPAALTGTIIITLTQNAASLIFKPVTTVSSSGSAQTLTASPQQPAYDVTLTGNCAFTLAGGLAGQCPSVLLLARGGAGGFTPSFTNTVLWSNATPPSGAVGSGQVFRAVLETPDNGATWLGSY